MNTVDTIIIGAGPAGMMAAFFTASFPSLTTMTS